MTDFRFANPDWMHAIWIVLLITALLVALEIRGQSVLDQFLSKIMQSRMVHRVSISRRLVSIAFVSLSMLLLVFTLMQPQWGRTVKNLARVESQMMICLDVSKSMLAEDVAPSRLERAKVEIDSLLGLMNEGQQVGLIEFAGRASVMCPMTTDFGFLRLILRDAKPENVGLGGTKIGEAIRKAIDGFGDAGDINRLIMVLTDGEDHDSFPLEVAATAREKGIKIVSVGFGDEAGSKIEITDPKTGARLFVKDREGNDVVSRLDGATLRDIAMETEGAYIPAETGALDLESIYNAHIKTLLSGSNPSDERVIRNEAFQWPLLGAIVMLLFGLFVSVPFRLRERAAAAGQFATTTGKAALVLLATGVILTHSAAAGQQTTPPEGQSTSTGVADEQPAITESEIASDGDDEAASISAIPEDISPRDAYNQSLQFVSSDPDQAEAYLNRARRDAGVDGEVRFRSLYNLGWVEVNRADQLLEQAPQQALTHLQQAANRFREAIRVRPDSQESRHNLEIVSRRILELADSLNKKDPRDLAARLDELIQQIREHQAEIRNMAQSTTDQVGAGDTANLRKPFRQLGVTQRQVISDLQRFSDDARQELDGIQAKKPEELNDEEKIKIVQVGNMLSYLDSGLQRMNQARSLTRRMQAVRGFQRWSAALSDAKRARDQLRNPVEIIGQLVADTAELNELTRSFEQEKTKLLVDESAEKRAWLTTDYLTETQSAIEQRTNELIQVFKQTVESQSAQSTVDSEVASTPDQVETQQLMENVRKCLPVLEAAATDFATADKQLNDSSIPDAIETQISALTHLNEAWELFFDIRRLIEAAYRDESLVGTRLLLAKTQPSVAIPVAEVSLPMQQKNAERCQRLEELIEIELTKISQPVTTGQPPGANVGESKNDEQLAAEKQRLELAKTLLARVVVNIEDAEQSLTQIAKRDPEAVSEKPDQTAPESDALSDSKTGDESEEAKVDPEIESASENTEAAIINLEELRRLFFSLIEHLKDTANRQSNLFDETQSQADEIESEPAAELQQKLGPLLARQEQLKSMSEQIAKALEKQSKQAANSADQTAAGAQQQDPQQAAAATKKLADASLLVEKAATDMESAANQLKEIAEFPDDVQPQEGEEEEANARRQTLNSATDRQQSALENLLKALELLDQQNQDQQNQNQQSEDQQQNESEQNEQQQRQQQQQMNAQQLLQMIRDREAERRKNKQQQVQGAGAVDKDW